MRRIRLSTPVAAVLTAVLLLFASGGQVSTVTHDTVAPSAATQSTTGGTGSPYISTHLYFGTGRHGGEPPITDDQFMKFVADVITPRFPSGLTLQEARGQWRDKEGDINRERSYELTVLYPVHEAEARNKDIEYIRDLYCEIYELESVGRADVQASVDF